MMLTRMDIEGGPYLKAPPLPVTAMVISILSFGLHLKCNRIKHFTNIHFPDLLHYAKQTKENSSISGYYNMWYSAEGNKTVV